ncbi:MAG: hypothetical protein PWR31_1385 [Bacillota bacterium]|nr:hypothetical protein [Bacillota bacterium]
MALLERMRYGLDPETLHAVREEVRRELEREERERAGRFGRRRPSCDEADEGPPAGLPLRARVLRGIRADLRRGRGLRSRMEGAEDPFVYRALEALLAEAEEQGLTIRELILSLPEISRVGAGILQPRLQRFFRSEQGRSFLLGMGAAVVVLALVPAAQKTLRPLALKVAQEVMEIAEQFQASLGQAKEGLQDIMAEAQFARAQSAVQAAGEAATGPAGEGEE